jgi:hypothetical protein
MAKQRARKSSVDTSALFSVMVASSTVDPKAKPTKSPGKAEKAIAKRSGVGRPPKTYLPRVGSRTKSEREWFAVRHRGQLLKAIREQWEQETGGHVRMLCAKANVSYNVYYGYEGGRTDMTLTTAARISKVLPMRVVIEDGVVAIERVVSGH